MTNELVQGALVDSQSAFGLALLRPGYGRTPEDDRLYALGWPNMSWLTPGDASEKELDDRKLLSSRYPFECGPIPAGVVPRRVRTLAEIRKNKGPGFAYLDASPIGAKERESLFDFALTEQLGFATTMMLESILGTPVVLNGYVERLRKLKPKDWTGAFGSADGALRAIHFMLLRTEATQAKKLREELSRIHAAASKAGRSNALSALDVAVNGREGVERSGEREGDDDLIMDDAEYVLDDPGYVRDKVLAAITKMKPADRGYVSGRLAFLGGDEVFEAIAKNIKRIHSSNRESLAVSLSRCAHPRVAEIMTALGTPTAKEWLKGQSGTAAPPKKAAPAKKAAAAKKAPAAKKAAPAAIKRGRRA
jgi:hypothetical protein